jgi:hypothetical protein
MQAFYGADGRYFGLRSLLRRSVDTRWIAARVDESHLSGAGGASAGVLLGGGREADGGTSPLVVIGGLAEVVTTLRAR